MKKLIALSVLSAMIVSFIAPFFGRKDIVEETVSVEENEKNLVKETEIKSEVDIAIENLNVEMEQISSIEDKKEWYIAYKEVLNKYSNILDPQESIYDYFTDKELDLLFRVVQAEVGDENTFEQKCNAASVIFNRVEHEMFPNSLFEVLSEDQFCTIKNGSYKRVEVSDTTILACEYAFMIEDNTYGSLFFDSNGSLNYQFVINDGIHNFYTLKEH